MAIAPKVGNALIRWAGPPEDAAAQRSGGEATPSMGKLCDLRHLGVAREEQGPRGHDPRARTRM